MKGEWAVKVMDAGVVRTRTCKSRCGMMITLSARIVSCEGSGRDTKVWMKPFTEGVSRRTLCSSMMQTSRFKKRPSGLR